MFEQLIANSQFQRELASQIDAELAEISANTGVESAGTILNARLEPDVVDFSGGPYWAYFKAEFFDLVCTRSDKYTKLRERIEALGPHADKVATAIATGIAGAMAGISVALLVPFVSLALIATAKLGLNAWCTMRGQQLKFEDNGEPLLLPELKTADPVAVPTNTSEIPAQS